MILRTKDKSELPYVNFDKGKTGTFKERIYQCANQLFNHRKSDLETSKADIEFFIENQRTFAAFLAVVGVIVSNLVSLRIPEDSKLYVAAIIAVIFAGFSAIILIEVARKVAWLQILKIALARKSDAEKHELNQPTNENERPCP